MQKHSLICLSRDEEFNQSLECLHSSIGCANSAKGRSMLAWELLDEFSSQSEPSRLVSLDIKFALKSAKALSFFVS